MIQREVLIGRSVAGTVVEHRSEDTPARGKLTPQNIDPGAKRLDRVVRTFEGEDQAGELLQCTPLWPSLDLNQVQMASALRV